MKSKDLALISARFPPRAQPDAEEVVRAIEGLLEAK